MKTKKGNFLSEKDESSKCKSISHNDEETRRMSVVPGARPGPRPL